LKKGLINDRPAAGHKPKEGVGGDSGGVKNLKVFYIEDSMQKNSKIINRL